MFRDRNVELNADEFHYKRQRYIHNNEKKKVLFNGDLELIQLILKESDC